MQSIPLRDAAQAHSLLVAIVESSDDAILSKDLNGIITSWNQAAERILGYSAGEIVGVSVMQLVPEHLFAEERSILSRLRKGERIEHLETLRLTKSGKPLTVSVTISPIYDEARNIVGASTIARDISERKAMERRMVESEKIAAAGRMAATIAHEINNPLEAVMNLIYLAQLKSATDEQVREYLSIAEKEVERVSLIVRQTLGFFRETAKPVNSSVTQLLDELLTVYSAKLASRGIELHRDYGLIQSLTMRKGELTQLFANLISNAIDAMPYGGVLSISVVEADASVQPNGIQDVQQGICVRITDTGAGIPSEHLERIFEPFFTTKEPVGTGIGLWLARQFAEGHGSSIHVTSHTDAHKHGSVFTVFLPYENGVEQVSL